MAKRTAKAAGMRGAASSREREGRRSAPKSEAVREEVPKKAAARAKIGKPGKAAKARAKKLEHDLFDLYESIHYREFKILLKAADFDEDVSVEVHDYWKLARRIAGQLLISVRRGEGEEVPQYRDVVFLDTPARDLYRSSYMLRVRRPYVGGVPGDRYELTLKFRSPDIAHAAEVDVSSSRGAPGRVKFKEEILLVGSELGGMRSVFSHTCQMPDVREPLGRTVAEYSRIFPVLATLGLRPSTRIAPAAPVPVQEVLYELGEFGFRGAKTAKVDMAVWRNPQTKKIMIGEFAYETHFRHYGRLHPVPKLRSERLYRLLQRETGAWVELGTTKTAMYYALSGKKIRHDE